MKSPLAHRFFVLLFLGLLAPEGLAGARAAWEPAAIVSEVVDGDTVVLDRATDGATQVRLVGIQAPKLPLGRPNFPTWPLAGEARTALESLALNKPVALDFGGRRMDRHGRLLAHLRLEDGTWVQGELLRQGMARVYSFPDNRHDVAEMLALEQEARAAKRGIWGHPFYALRGPDGLERELGTFQVVEGRVTAAASVRGRVYLNFGENWREDFTVTISSQAMKLFVESGIEPWAWKGRVVRARGWLRKNNGPMIEATHPEQIELPEN